MTIATAATATSELGATGMEITRVGLGAWDRGRRLAGWLGGTGR